MEKIGDYVNTMSGGRFDLTVFPGDAIVPITEQFDACEAGALDAILMSPANQRNRYGPVTQLFDEQPGGLTSPQHLAWQYLGNQEGLKLLRELYSDADVHIVGDMSATGPEIEMWANKKMLTVDDYKGLKVRTGGGWGEILKDFDAAVVSMSGAEIYGALQRGVIDALEYGTPSVDVDMGFYEIAKYLHYPGIHSPGAGSPMLAVNKQRWEELPEDMQLMITKCCISQAYEDLFTGQMKDGAALEFYVSKGIELVELSDEIQMGLVELTDKLNDEYAAQDAFYAKVLASQRALVAEQGKGSMMIADFARIRSLIEQSK